MTLARIRHVPAPKPLCTRWDVYRDDQGNPVTITEQQLYAIWHAVHVVDQVRRAEGDCKPMGEAGNWQADTYKSRLLGRMLLLGRPPLDVKPPDVVMGARDYTVDPDWRGVTAHD